MLKTEFLKTISRFTNNNTIPAKYWFEIERKYTGKKRYYHNLIHLDNLLEELAEYKTLINDWDVMVCSVAWHDFIYNVLKQDNEAKSADFAEKKLSALHLATDKIEKCKALINATKNHGTAGDTNINFFIDADLSILGKPWQTYYTYATQIRAEYSICPDIIYKPGRRKVLEHFLAMPRIFKTEQFFGKYEEQSRLNMIRELHEL